MNKNLFKTLGFVRAALVIGVGIQVPMVSDAFAQLAAAPTLSQSIQAEAERVIVTGSNIPTAEEVGPNPVLNINRDLIDKSGERNAAALIKALPVANANGVPIS